MRKLPGLESSTHRIVTAVRIAWGFVGAAAAAAAREIVREPLTGKENRAAWGAARR
jgi:hypothetical protein